MGYLGTWAGYAGLFLALMAVVFLPGYIALRFLRFPRFGSFALAPAWTMAIDSVFFSIVVRNVDVEGKILANGLRSIEYDPRVCQVLNAYGINYYYEDAPITYQGINGAESVPGLHSVDTSNGYFHLVAEVDGARLWQITGCPGRAEAPNWWNVRDRRLSVIQPPLDSVR